MKCLYGFEVGDARDADGQGAHMRQGDDQVAVVVDALDGTLDALERATLETDMLPLASEEVGIGEIGALTVGVIDTHGLDELLHGMVGDGDDRRGLDIVTDDHIAQRLQASVGLFQFTDLTTAGMDENQMVGT